MFWSRTLLECQTEAEPNWISCWASGCRRRYTDVEQQTRRASADDALVRQLLPSHGFQRRYSMLFCRLSDLPEQIDPLRDCFCAPRRPSNPSGRTGGCCWRALWPRR